MYCKAKSKLLLAVLIMTLMFPIGVSAKEVYEMPTNSSFKSYMDYRTITNTKSKQYAIQQQCTTDEHGLRTYKGYYTVAIGTGFGASVGDYIDVQLSSGTLLHCVVGEMKQNIHTDATNRQVAGNGNVVEFIVDTHVLNHDAKRDGNISSIRGFEGYVETVTVLTHSEEAEVKPTITKIADEDKPTYLICGKCQTPLSSGETLYMIEYAFGSDFNSIICSRSFYESVSVGDEITSLE